MGEAKEILSKHDAILAQIIASVPEPLIKSTNHVFHDLMSCVLEQQIHYRSTKKVFQKMLAAANLEMLTPANFSDFEQKAFSNVKLSINKYETILEIIEFWQDNKIDWEALNDEEVTSKLSSIKGIGQWTIDMILLYTLQRPCVFPVDDFHLKQIMVDLYKLNPATKLKAQMTAIAAQWGGHKSLAVTYLLAWKEHQKMERASNKTSKI